MNSRTISLPIDAFIPEILTALTTGSTLILKAEPGAGKTTRVPLALLDLPGVREGDLEVWVLEPRRLAAKMSAERVASELREECGERVGYHFRFERKASQKTRLLYLTEGMLLKRITQNPGLKGVGALVLDEFHERSIHTDLALALALRLQKTSRPDLKLVIMSATLDGERLATFLKGGVKGATNLKNAGKDVLAGAQKGALEKTSENLNGVTALDCPGRTFTVTTEFLSVDEAKQSPYLEHKVKRAIQKLLALKVTDPKHPGASGDVLVFLPGMAEILRTKEQLLSFSELDLAILHGDLSREEQNHALKSESVVDPEATTVSSSKSNGTASNLSESSRKLSGTASKTSGANARRRKIILATNIAETSITLPGITTVLDGGFHRQGGYAHGSGMNQVDLKRISKASAVQRGGRAGRVREGYCLRLYTKGDFEGFAPFDLPEILRTDLSSMLLDLLNLELASQGLFSNLDFFEAPPIERVQSAMNLLTLLGAISVPPQAVQGPAPLEAPESELARTSLSQLSSSHFSPPQSPALKPPSAQLTERGKRMSTLGLHPRAARIFDRAQELGFTTWAPWLAAWVAEGRKGGKGDLSVEALPALKRFKNSPGFSGEKVVERLQKDTAQKTKLQNTTSDSTAFEDALGAILLAGFPDRLAKITRVRADGADVLLSQGGSAVLPDVALAQSADYFVVCDATEVRGTPVLRSVCAVSEEDIWSLEPSILQEATAYSITADSRRVILSTKLSVGQLILDENKRERLGGEVGPFLLPAVSALCDWILAQGPSLTKSFATEQEVEAYTARGIFVKSLRPDFTPLELGSLLRATALECFSLPSAGGIISLKAFENYWHEWGGLAHHYKNSLDNNSSNKSGVDKNSSSETDSRDWSTLAPEFFELPGRDKKGKKQRAVIHYERERGPWIESRLQDFFGLTSAPTVGGGKVKLTVHLLAPNYRAVQVTQDLPSFWKNAYHEVRKELMRRYPRHKWPEDPLAEFTEA